MTANRNKKKPRVARIKPAAYQPTKAEMEKEVRFEGTPDQVLHRMFQPVKIVRDPDSET